jgi:hypothetical protein
MVFVRARMALETVNPFLRIAQMAALVGRNRITLLVVGMTLLLSAALVVPSMVSAQEQPRGERGDRGQRGPTSGPAMATQSLERNMGAMNRVWRTIKANLKDKTKNEATLTLLAQMQAATLAAKGQVPTSLAATSGEEKNKKLSEYRADILKLLRQELELEEQLMAGDNDKAAATAIAMDETQKAGHQEFRKQD